MNTPDREPPRPSPLPGLARMEAWKARMAESVPADPARLAAGWERRFVASGERVEEMASLYRELGFEVCADPVDPSTMEDECAGCGLVAALAFVTLYTRRPSAPTGEQVHLDPHS